MTQYKDMIDQARQLLRTEQENTPSMMHDFSDPEESWLLVHPCGKVIKTFKDKRKRDIVIQESFNGGEL